MDERGKLGTCLLDLKSARPSAASTWDYERPPARKHSPSSHSYASNEIAVSSRPIHVARTASIGEASEGEAKKLHDEYEERGRSHH